MSSLRTRERVWFIATLIIGLVSLIILFIALLYIFVAMQGLNLSNETHLQEEKDMNFLRVAAGAKYMCRNQKADYVSVHCGSVRENLGYFDEKKHDIVLIATNSSYQNMIVNSTMYSILPIPFTLQSWTMQQRFLMSLYALLAGPTLLLIISLVLCSLLVIPTYFALSKLHSAVATRKQAMEIFNRPLAEVIEEKPKMFAPNLNSIFPTQPTATNNTTANNTYFFASHTMSNNSSEVSPPLYNTNNNPPKDIWEGLESLKPHKESQYSMFSSTMPVQRNAFTLKQQ